jgi:CheY-like chemotaxis protein
MSRVLVVDDSAAVRQLLHAVLEAQGHAVVEAETWCEATDILNTRCIELAVVDGQFPRDQTSPCAEAFGPVVCQQARALGARTVLVSGDGDLVDQEARAGFPALRKPFALRAILQAVETPAGGAR